MKKHIFITGIAGSGKSTTAKELKGRGYEAYDLEEYPELFQIEDLKTGEVLDTVDNDNIEQLEQYDWVCKRGELEKLIQSSTGDVNFYATTASNLENILDMFDEVILLTVSDEIMTRRLSEREVGEYGQTKEVQQWILSWKEWWENWGQKQSDVVIDGDNALEEVVAAVLDHAYHTEDAVNVYKDCNKF